MESVPAGKALAEYANLLSKGENCSQRRLTSDPACVTVESKNTRLRISSETDERIRKLHVQAKLRARPNLPSASRRETLLHLIHQHESVAVVLQILLDAVETRSLWRTDVVR